MTLTVVLSHPFAENAKGWGSLILGNRKGGPTRRTRVSMNYFVP
jgi:hypothetical protein